jgi:hypothetical protein
MGQHMLLQIFFIYSQTCFKWLPLGQRTRGSVGWACVAHLSFCFEETYTEPPIHVGASHQVLVIWLNSYKEEDIQKSTNQKQEWPVVAMFIDRSELNEQSL